jgi:hypothetical protein
MPVTSPLHLSRPDTGLAVPSPSQHPLSQAIGHAVDQVLNREGIARQPV